jgi:hypothetical protein
MKVKMLRLREAEAEEMPDFYFLTQTAERELFS